MPRLDTLPARVRGCIKTTLIKAGSLTLGILKSLYPRAALDIVEEGWAAGTTQEKAQELMNSFRGAALKLASMLGTEPEYDSESWMF